MCFGFEVNAAGVCKLLGREFIECDPDELSHMNTLPGAVPTYTAGPGQHLVQADATARTVTSLNRVGHACYKRATNCSTTPDCKALGRYGCERGMLLSQIPKRGCSLSMHGW